MRAACAARAAAAGASLFADAALAFLSAGVSFLAAVALAVAVVGLLGHGLFFAIGALRASPPLRSSLLGSLVAFFRFTLDFLLSSSFVCCFSLLSSCLFPLPGVCRSPPSSRCSSSPRRRPSSVVQVRRTGGMCLSEGDAPLQRCGSLLEAQGSYRA